MRFLYFFGGVFFLLLIRCYASNNEPAKFLHTQGQNIVDGEGNPVMLRGVGLGNWLLPEGYMWKFGAHGDRPRKIEQLVTKLIGQEKAANFWQDFRRYYITELDIQRIAQLGFNSVRPALNARLFLTEGDSAVFIEDHFILLDNLIKWSKKYGLYVILDMHAAPGGQTGANIDDSPNDEPELFTDASNQDRLVRLWVKLARRYVNDPTVIAYDLLNEPLPARSGAAKKYGHLVMPLYKRLIKAIRKVDKNHMITLEGVDWANDWSIFGEHIDANLFYQFHYYCWNRPDNLNDISKYIKLRDKMNAPVWVGETGEKGNTIYWATSQYFEANNIGWSFWPWKKMDTENTPYSIKSPLNWGKIVDYSHGKEKPSTETAQKALDEFIENIKLENCVFFEDVTNSILRRAPVRIEAENYGHQGYNNSYFVKDTTQRSKYYRVNEPIKVELISHTKDQFWSEQYIRLQKNEWVQYRLNNTELKKAQLTIRVKTKRDKSEVTFSLNNRIKTFRLTNKGWQTISAPLQGLNRGWNTIRLSVTEGAACFDWIEVQRK